MSLNFIKHYRESFGAKIYFLFSLFMIVIFTIIIVFFINHQHNVLKHQLIDKGSYLAGFLAYTSKLAVFAENQDLLKNQVEGVLQDSEVKLIQVFTSDGKELIARFRSGEGNIKEPLESDYANWTKGIGNLRDTGVPLYSEYHDKIEFLSPVTLQKDYIDDDTLTTMERPTPSKDDVIGFVRIILTKELLNENFITVLLKSIMILILFVISSCFIIYYLVRIKITKPLNSLAGSAQALGEGDLFSRVQVDSIDEIGKLASTFNIMVQSLEKRESEKQQLLSQLMQSRDELRNLAFHLQSAIEKERTSIAREIHDELGQYLTALNLDLFWISKKLNKDQELLINKVNSMTKLLKMINESLQNISLSLRPGLLDDLGLIAAIEWLREGFQERTGIEYKLIADPKNIVLCKDISTVVFRIFQESFTNVARHTNATKVRANLTLKADILTLKISDNGEGITPEKVNDPSSFGLIGIRERVYSLQGTCEIRGAKDRGSTIIVSLPIIQR